MGVVYEWVWLCVGAFCGSYPSSVSDEAQVILAKTTLGNEL